ncbi:MAG: NAD(P)-dependent oxidoreductase [Alphaproteobacteria bacterium]|nr:NAD(P)-dependent oxidoreductase [Alphaproteobacteria bacterium]
MEATKRNVGYIGVGLMGHGAARNILEKGHALAVLGNRNRAPVEDLVRRGAREAASPAELARDCDVVFMCLPSSVEVERTVLGPDGLLAAARPGLVVVDSTTADPNSTRRLGEALRARGADLVDAPMGRTPKEAEAGRLSTFVGGRPESVAIVRPIIEAYAEVIIDAGELGAGHTLKLCNNFISIGTCAVISEAVATAAKLGVDLGKLNEVVSAGGANSAMFQMVMPWVLEGDDSRLKGPLRIAGKDLRFFCRLAESVGMASFVAQACSQVYVLANAQGHAERFMPTLPGIVAELNGARIRDLPPA